MRSRKINVFLPKWEGQGSRELWGEGNLPAKRGTRLSQANRPGEVPDPPCLGSTLLNTKRNEVEERIRAAAGSRKELPFQPSSQAAGRQPSPHAAM